MSEPDLPSPKDMTDFELSQYLKSGICELFSRLIELRAPEQQHLMKMIDRIRNQFIIPVDNKRDDMEEYSRTLRILSEMSDRLYRSETELALMSDSDLLRKFDCISKEIKKRVISK